MKDFVKMCLLLELLSHCFTSRKITPDPPAVESNEEQDEESEDGQLLPSDDVTANQSSSCTSIRTADIEEDEEVKDDRLWCYCRQSKDYD